LKSLFTYGNRYEVGYMDANDYGWLVSAISQVSQNQDCTLTDAQVLFNDPQFLLRGFRDSFPQADGFDDDINLNGIFGRDGLDSDGNGVPDTVFPTVDWGDAIQYLPRFDIITAFNHTSVNGVEVMRMYRAPRLHNGGVFELLYGARLLAIEDRFRLLGMNTAAHAQPPNGGGNQVTTPGRLDDIFLENRIENNIVGPQIGGRWYNQRGRWITSLEGRFMAGANFQNGRQRVSYNSTSAMNPQNMALFIANQSNQELFHKARLHYFLVSALPAVGAGGPATTLPTVDATRFQRFTGGPAAFPPVPASSSARLFFAISEFPSIAKAR
jgi:hypothetical protein